MEKETEWNINYKIQIILKLIIVMSCSILTILWSTRFDFWGTILGALASLSVAEVFMFRNGYKAY